MRVANVWVALTVGALVGCSTDGEDDRDSRPTYDTVCAGLPCESWGECAFSGACQCYCEDGCCRLDGHDVVPEDCCDAVSVDDCAASQGCSQSGKCGLGDGECTAVSQDDCSNSDHCLEMGMCTLCDGACLRECL